VPPAELPPPPAAEPPPAGADAAPGPSQAQAWSWRRLLPKLLLAGAIALALTQLLPALPSDQQLEIDVPTGPGVVHQLELIWSRVGDASHAGGVRLAVPLTSAGTIHHTVRAPDGPYDLRLVVQRRLSGGTLTETSHHRRVTLRGGRTRIVLEPEPQ